jgi:hypothetical protein
LSKARCHEDTKEKPMSIDLEKVIEELKQSRFWGSVELTLQDGVPVIFKKSETIRLTQGKTYDRNKSQ